MSIQAQLNSLISQAGGYMVAQKKEQMAVEKAEAEAAEKEAKKAEREAQKSAELQKEAERNKAYESLEAQVRSLGDINKGLEERVTFLSSPRGAAETIGEAGLLSNKRQRELMRAAQQKEVG